MSSKSRKGRSHTPKGPLNIRQFTDWLNVKGEMRASHYNRKRKKAGFLGGGINLGRGTRQLRRRQLSRMGK